jgi:hypothetical protein
MAGVWAMEEIARPIVARTEKNKFFIELKFEANEKSGSLRNVILLLPSKQI